MTVWLHELTKLRALVGMTVWLHELTKLRALVGVTLDALDDSMVGRDDKASDARDDSMAFPIVRTVSE